MAKTLTRKQETFVEAFVESGNGTISALAAYDTESKDVAKSIASENLTKPYVQEAIAERIKTREELVEEAHESLLTAVRLDYFVFPKMMKDEEITEHVEAQGLTVLNIRPSEKGKLAFYSIPDGQSRGKGIEIHHKVQGTFAPEKKINVNVEVAASPRISELTKLANEIYRGGNVPSDGGTASSVGSQASDKE